MIGFAQWFALGSDAALGDAPFARGSAYDGEAALLLSAILPLRGLLSCLALWGLLLLCCYLPTGHSCPIMSLLCIKQQGSTGGNCCTKSLTCFNIEPEESTTLPSTAHGAL